VGSANARDIMISARFFEAAEAYQMGLINFVVPSERLQAEVTAYAMRVAANAPLTVHAARETIRAVLRPDKDQDPKAIQELIDACFNSQDYKEGRRAFKEKRTPNFKGV